MVKYNSVILAAGYGKRMLPLTKNTPKPLLPNLENSLILNQINFLKQYDLNICISIGYQKEKMISALKRYGIEDFIYSKNKGNAYWLNKLEDEKKVGPLIVITSDNIMQVNIHSLIKEYFKKGEKSLIISTNSYTGTHDKLEINDKNEVLSMNYQQVAGKIASGLQILNPQDIYEDKSFFNDFHEVWSSLIKKKKLIVSEFQPKKWISIDTVEDLNKIYY